MAETSGLVDGDVSLDALHRHWGFLMAGDKYQPVEISDSEKINAIQAARCPCNNCQCRMVCVNECDRFKRYVSKGK